jgi:membrane protein
VTARAAGRRTARSPADIGERGWRAILARTWRAVTGLDVPMLAAGIAFYGVWAFFPALVALVVLAGWLFGRAESIHLVAVVRAELSPALSTVVSDQLTRVAQQPRGYAVATIAGALLLAVWAGMRGVRGLSAALNAIYHEEETRGFWHRQALAFGLSALSGAFLVTAAVMVAGLPALRAFANVNAPASVETAVKWIVVVLLLMLLLSVLYRYAPSRRKPRWRWVTWGATFSAASWVVVSAAFSYYAAQYGRLNPLLGSLGAVAIFMLWSYIGVLTVLAGAQLNAEIERQA